MIQIDARSTEPIYEQIIRQMKEYVLKGYLKQGDPVPSVRKLAFDLSVTPGTVAKAYQELERQKVIETIRGKGTYIRAEGGNRNEERMKEAKRVMKAQIVELSYMGISKEMIHQMIEEWLKEME